MPSTPPSSPGTVSFGPDDFEPTTDLEVTAEPAASAGQEQDNQRAGTESGDQNDEKDGHSLLQHSLLSCPKSSLCAATDDQRGVVGDSGDVSSFVQGLMEASDVETDHVDHEAGDNIEYSRWGPHVRAEVMQTLDTLWERGDEMVVEAIAQRFMQMGGQMQQASFTDHYLSCVAHAVKRFCKLGLPPAYLKETRRAGSRRWGKPSHSLCTRCLRH